MKIHSIFPSISGEVGPFCQGEYCVFIRTSGCNLNCPYCDALEAKTTGRQMSVYQIMNDVKSYKTKNVVITGGEPLLQPAQEMMNLCNHLMNNDYTVSMETNGSVYIPINLRVDSFVVDYKLDFPELMNFENFPRLGKDDFIKFVVSMDNIDRAIKIHTGLIGEGVIAKIAYSPLMPITPLGKENWVQEIRKISQLIYDKCTEKHLPFIINVQLHKILSFD